MIEWIDPNTQSNDPRRIAYLEQCRSNLATFRVGDIAKQYVGMDWAYGPVRKITSAYLVVEFGWGIKYYVFDEPAQSLEPLGKGDPTKEELLLKYEWMK